MKRINGVKAKRIINGSVVLILEDIRNIKTKINEYKVTIINDKKAIYIAELTRENGLNIIDYNNNIVFRKDCKSPFKMFRNIIRNYIAINAHYNLNKKK